MMPLFFSRGMMRRWEWTDKPALMYYANNYNISKNLRNRFPFPYTESDADLWLHINEISQEPLHNFAIVVENEAIGGIGIEIMEDVHAHTGELGYWLGEPHWGRGIMSEVVQVMLRYVFGTLHLIRVHAYVYDNNPASIHVLQKNGFVYEGTLSKYVMKNDLLLDAHLYACINPIYL